MMASGDKRPRVRVSKNRKKAWGKHCDIKDVESFLVKERKKEITLGPVSQRGPLFHIDKGPVSVTTESKRAKNQSLKCHSNLGQYSKVPAPVDPQHFKIGKKQKFLQTRKLERKFKNILKSQSKDGQANDDSGCILYDIWADDKDKQKNMDLEMKSLLEYQDEITKKKPVKVPCYLYQKPSLLPAVEIPHPGSSYNPTYEDHQELLQKAVSIEDKKEKAEMHLKRILTDMFPDKADAPNEQTVLEEMSQGLFDDAVDDESQLDGDTILSSNPPVSTESRKTKSQKRKEKERKLEERKKLLEKKKRMEVNEIFRLKNIKAEIRKADKLQKEHIAKRSQKTIEKMYTPHTLSKYKFEPTDLEVNLSEDIRGSMREIKVEGNILEDRYKSLQKRNIIEPRVKQKKTRKYKVKTQVKRSHRNFE